VHGHVDGEAVDALAAEDVRGDAGHGHGLWTLATLEAFLRRESW
jgi:hypothetical protein